MTYETRKAIRGALNELDREEQAKNVAIRKAMEEMRRARYRTIRNSRWAGE